MITATTMATRTTIPMIMGMITTTILIPMRIIRWVPIR
jgi:hypothetical protein